MFHVESSGMAQISQAFDLFVVAVRDKMLKHAVKRAGTPIRDHAKSLVKRGAGVLQDSIVLVMKNDGQRGNVIHGYIGPQTKIRIPVLVTRGKHAGKLKIAIPTRYAHLVEYGHRVIINGKLVGHVAPQPFMRPAWEQHGGDRALTIIQVDLSEQIADWLSKLP